MKRLVAAVALAIGVAFWGCKKDKVAVSKITLDRTYVTLTKGDRVVLSAKVSPDNAADKSVVWRTSDEKVATVDSDGKVTATGPGEASITVKANDKNGTKADCTVEVLPKDREVAKDVNQKYLLGLWSLANTLNEVNGIFIAANDNDKGPAWEILQMVQALEFTNEQIDTLHVINVALVPTSPVREMRAGYAIHDSTIVVYLPEIKGIAKKEIMLTVSTLSDATLVLLSEVEGTGAAVKLILKRQNSLK